MNLTPEEQSALESLGEADRVLSIDLATGQWVTSFPITFEEACTVASSVLPGTTPEEVANWYDSQFDTPDDNLP